MQVISNVNYYNKIMTAIVVNADSTNDPASSNRVQIFIPEIQSDGAIYKLYQQIKDSGSSEHKDEFIWAYNTVTDLKNKDIVYVSNLSNDIGNYVIIGRDVAFASSGSGIGGGSGGLDMGSIVDYTIRICLFCENSIGQPPLYEKNGWPDSIPSDKYGGYTTKMVGNGVASLGLFQWTGSRAYDMLLEIAKSDSNWESYWSDKEDCLYTQLKNDVNKGTNSNSKINCLYATEGSSKLNSIKSMLTSKIGQETQQKIARQEMTDIITALQDMGISNPGVLIIMGDWCNQHIYKNVDALYWKNSKFKEVYEIGQKPLNHLPSNGNDELNKVMSSYENPSDMIKEVEAFYIAYLDYFNNRRKCQHASYCPKRRETARNYIRELYKQGKLAQAGMTMLGNLQQFTYKGLTLAWPFEDVVDTKMRDVDGGAKGPYIVSTKSPKQYYITSLYGWRTFDGSHPHTGIDFGTPRGTTFYASHDGMCWAEDSGRDSYKVNGKWVYQGGYGYCVKIEFENNGDKWLIIYGHCIRGSGSQYNITSKKRQVRAGEAIAQGNSTGSSTGNHLHFELRRNGKYVNPLPYLGLGNAHYSLVGAANYLEE